MNKSKTHNIGRTKDNNKQNWSPIEEEKNTNHMLHSKHKETTTVRQKENIHKKKLNSHMTYKIHTAQMTSKKFYKNHQAYLELHRTIFYS
jgi:hypothetical protein